MRSLCVRVLGAWFLFSTMRLRHEVCRRVGRVFGFAFADRTSVSDESVRNAGARNAVECSGRQFSCHGNGMTSVPSRLQCGI